MARRINALLSTAVISVVMIIHTLATNSHSRYCKHAYYFSKEKSMCVPCAVRCNSNQGLAMNCGYDEYGNKLKASCELCPAGHYSKIERDKDGDYRECAPCTPCSSLGRGYKRNCSSSANAVCNDCRQGYYESDHRCHPCAPCCGNHARMYRREKCVKDGMGADCSCISTFCNSHTCKIPTTAPRKTSLSTTASNKVPKPESATPKSTSSVITSSEGRLTSPSKSTTTFDKAVTKQNGVLTMMSAIKLKKGRTLILPSTKASERNHTVVLKRFGFSKRVTKGKKKEQFNTKGKKKDQHETDGNLLASKTTKTLSQEAILYIVIGIAVMLLCVLFGIFIRRRKRRSHRSKMSFNDPDDLPPQEALTDVNASNSDAYTLLENSCKRILAQPTGANEDKAPAVVDVNDKSPLIAQTEISFEGHFYHDSAKELLVKSEPFKTDDDEASLDASHYAESCFVPSTETEEAKIHTEKSMKASDPSNEKTTPVDTSALLVKKPLSNQRFKRLHSMPAQTVMLQDFTLILGAGGCAKMIGDLKTCLKRELERYLDAETSGVANWKEIAVYFGANERLIDVWEAKFQSGCSPTGTVLRYMISKGRKVLDLVKCLGKIERLDAREAFLTHLVNGCQICNAITEETEQM